MATREHVQLVARENRDKWKTDHPDSILDLSKAQLSGVDLRGANLRGANLYGPTSAGPISAGPASEGPISARPTSARRTSAGSTSVKHYCVKLTLAPHTCGTRRALWNAISRVRASWILGLSDSLGCYPCPSSEVADYRTHSSNICHQF